MNLSEYYKLTIKEAFELAGRPVPTKVGRMSQQDTDVFKALARAYNTLKIYKGKGGLTHLAELLGKHHSVVIYYRKECENLCQVDEKYQFYYMKVLEMCRKHQAELEALQLPKPVVLPTAPDGFSARSFNKWALNIAAL